MDKTILILFSIFLCMPMIFHNKAWMTTVRGMHPSSYSRPRDPSPPNAPEFCSAQPAINVVLCFIETSAKRETTFFLILFYF